MHAGVIDYDLFFKVTDQQACNVKIAGFGIMLKNREKVNMMSHVEVDTEHLKLLCDPITKGELEFKDHSLVNSDGDKYEIKNGIPILLELTDRRRNEYALNLFHQKADVYDKYQHLSFETFNLDENDVRNSLIDKLRLRGNERVLELNAGTGRDSLLINQRLLGGGKLCVQDISFEMLSVLTDKLKNDVYVTQSNAEALPYKDNTFEGVYSFGGVGMNAYSDTNKIMSEIVRVSKRGARIVIGGLGMAPWLYDTEFGRILINHNNHYANVFDLSTVPVEARDVEFNWILNGAGFCVSFTIGEGEPDANFDYQIPGVRGGTLRTRYYGRLEGVAPETKDKLTIVREKLGISMYDLLNGVLNEYCQKILAEDNK